jgi:hypothetical protein
MADRHPVLALFFAGIFASCGTSNDSPSADNPARIDAGTGDASTSPNDADAGDAGTKTDAADVAKDTLADNRDRLLASYLAYLRATPGPPQSNGLVGSALTGVCDLWRKLDPSAQGAFLTLTSRLQGSALGKDGSSMLVHVAKLYRIAGGEGATSTDPGSCGGGEFNRLIMSMDDQLRLSVVAASDNKGGNGTNGLPDIADVPMGANSFWRDTHDLSGTHGPFDISDETEHGAPRGQLQYFKDSNSAVAKTALGRTDLTTLVDPNALEIDQDYDCPHNSNPLCSYTAYAALCLPGPPKKGTELYTENYGSFDPSWQPADCAGK